MNTSNTIKAGSFSRLSIHQECARRAYLAYIEKIKEPDRGIGPLTAPDGSKEWHNDRGSRIHQLAQDYVEGLIDRFPNELRKFKKEIEELRKRYKSGKVFTEEMWCFTSDWMPCESNDWNNIYFRMITDITIFHTKKSATVIDYKTGRKFGNEIKHGQQAQLYQLGAFLRYPDLEEVTTEIWYIDQDEIATMEFNRNQGMRFFKHWDNRMKTMTQDVEFKPNPNMNSCRWCPYKPSRSGDCSVGV
jgi:hypothetical protein